VRRRDERDERDKEQRNAVHRCCRAPESGARSGERVRRGCADVAVSVFFLFCC
jgi:hypothetical protein